jgi:hypothetical protein
MDLVSMRKHQLNRWNWSERAEKWVYVRLDDGERVYKYSEEPPKKFISLSKELQELNKKLMKEKNHGKNTEIFKKMMKVSERMQNMKE